MSWAAIASAASRCESLSSPSNLTLVASAGDALVRNRQLAVEFFEQPFDVLQAAARKCQVSVEFGEASDHSWCPV